jgi:aminoglycoside phosphotransferase (APT) family kinase protein
MCNSHADPCGLDEIRRFAADLLGVEDPAMLRCRTRAPGSSQLVFIDLSDARTDGRKLVIRRYCDPDWLAREPDLPLREARMLRLAASASLPAPHFLGHVDAPTPMVAMTALPGRTLSAKDIRPAHLDAAAHLAARIHRTAIHEDEFKKLPRYTPHYISGSLPITPPSWGRNQNIWRQAITLYFQWPGTHQKALIHRDFHMGNLLFEGTTPSGLVDWVTSCLGAPQADIGHMRWNLVLDMGFEAADRFTRAYPFDTSRAYDRIWDLYALVGVLPDLPPLTADAANRLETLLLAAFNDGDKDPNRRT